jgi:hypothetical protein
VREWGGEGLRRLRNDVKGALEVANEVKQSNPKEVNEK